MNLLKRIQSPTPRFFKVLRAFGLALAAGSSTLVMNPASLPAGLTSVAGYLVVAGGVIAAVSQTAVLDEKANSDGGP